MVNQIKAIKVTVNSSAGILNSTNQVVLKNTPTLIAGGSTRLDKLVDVDPSGEIDKATLIYDATQDKYIVKQMEFGDIAGDLDGGTF
jgi:hypothetical protein